MMKVYGLHGHQLMPVQVPSLESLPQASDLLWIDLLSPTKEEEHAVENLLDAPIPTREEMAEIEESARLYEENGALVMTAVLIDGFSERRPSRAQVTFILSRTHLVSVRYADPLPFRNFEGKCQRHPELHNTSDRLLVSLLESIVERLADVLEISAAELNGISDKLFVEEPHRRRPKRAENVLHSLVRQLGRKNMTVSILRESLLSLSRVVPFLRQNAGEWLCKTCGPRLGHVERDLRSLSAYEGQLSSEIAYLHQATLGLITLDQNQIIKVFTIAAVLFLPPTLVGTVYGMNFEVMPELKWAFGYPFALAMMSLSAVLPYYVFKRRGWF